MSLLSIIQSVATRIGIAVPSVVATSTDPQIAQLLALLNEEGDELATRYDWQALQTEATFLTVAAESQGLLATIAPNLRRITNDTIWNRDLRRPLFGPMSGQRWQQLKAMSMQGPWNQYRIRGGQIVMIPAPSAGQNCFFEYVTTAWARDSGGSDKLALTADDDVTKLDEKLLELGLKWRWKAAKGLTYAEEFNTYERRVMDAMAQDGGKDIINTGDQRYDIMPGITIPSGTWPV